LHHVKAAYITTLGSPDVITYGEMDRPVPGPTDVLVRVEAAAVDPVDTFVRSGAYRTPTPFPFVLGRDLVGTVAETGPGATGFAVGDRVWSHSMGHGGRQGVTAEYCVVASTGSTTCPATSTRPARSPSCTRWRPRTWRCSGTPGSVPGRPCW